MALERPERISGIVLLAPAVDSTFELMWNKFDTDIRREMENKGFWDRPSEFEDEAYPITMKLIEEARTHLLLDAPSRSQDRCISFMDSPTRSFRSIRSCESPKR
jgi:hypothetical protein